MKAYTLFSQDGSILPIAQATISLLNIEYSYGYGVYETLKVRNSKLYFVEYHLERLQHSAESIGISLAYPSSTISRWLAEFVERLQTQACNIKIVLIGGNNGGLYIFASAPLFPDRRLYKHGAHLTTYIYERLFPTAKTLNMLPSYLAYTQAKAAQCYDALLVDKQHIMLEGTRTNFCLIKGNTIIHAPKDRILDGITLKTVIPVAQELGFSFREDEVPLESLDQYDGAFITSTSSKIMPVSNIGTQKLSIPLPLRDLMKRYDRYLEST